MDDIQPPVILTGVKYIDMYSLGLTKTIEEIIRVIYPNPIKENESHPFQNVEVVVTPKARHRYVCRISARRFVEHSNSFAIYSYIPFMVNPPTKAGLLLSS